MTQFSDLGLAEPLLRALSDEGYETPTPIQAKAIPVALENRDVVGIAQTGTGKTAAFVLPILQEVAESKGKPQPKTARTLIVSPTRELAAQIAEQVAIYGKHVRHSAVVVVGGVKPGKQVRRLEQGVDVLVATPGRLLDHMETGAVSLRDTRRVVLDEADQMLDMGFIPAIRRIMKAVPDERQTMLFSATMPKQIRKLAGDFLVDPREIAVTPASTPIERIEQKVIFAEKPDKARLLIKHLQEAGIERAIVFTRTKHGADKLTRQLDKAGLSAGAIHGNKSQNQRKRTLDAFKAYNIHILVATDIAARGIDVDGVSHIVNFELPNVPESYVHRIGRTARAGKSGHALSFCSKEERPLLYDIEKVIKADLPKFKADGEAIEVNSAEREWRPQKPKPQGQKSKPHKPRRRRPRGSSGQNKQHGGRAKQGGQKAST